MFRLAWILASLTLGGVSAYCGQPFVHNNSDAVLVIITVMTVFAGFLIAIITILGDPAMMPDGSWRVPESRRDQIENRLIRYMWLFTLYLISIGLLFVGVLIKDAPEVSVPMWSKTWIERLYMFFATSSFLLTFALPRALWKLQLARVDAEIERRRKAAGIKD